MQRSRVRQGEAGKGRGKQGDGMERLGWSSSAQTQRRPKLPPPCPPRIKAQMLRLCPPPIFTHPHIIPQLVGRDGLQVGGVGLQKGEAGEEHREARCGVLGSMGTRYGELIAACNQAHALPFILRSMPACGNTILQNSEWDRPACLTASKPARLLACLADCTPACHNCQKPGSHPPTHPRTQPPAHHPPIHAPTHPPAG